MIISDSFSDYRLLDTGDGMKLEYWNGYTLARPAPQVIWPKQDPDAWAKADAVYTRSSSGGGSWEFMRELPERWTVSYRNLSFYVRPTGFKHTGLFPEQSANWDFFDGIIKKSGRYVRVLNLFAYTGGATLACAAAGAEVVHVDAAKSMVSWAKENAGLSGLQDRPVRYLVDDCLKFVLREQRRGNTYDGIIMDPPSYGRGADGKVFKLENDIFGLIEEAAKLLSSDPLFFVLNSYTTGLSSAVCSNMLRIVLGDGGDIESGDLCIPVESGGIYLPCGTTTRWKTI